MTENKENDPVLQAIDRARPLLSRLTFGSVVGYCSGMATQKVARAVALVAGLAFIALQTAASAGVLVMDWQKLQLHCHRLVDADGDGALGTEDLKLYWRRVREILTKNLPSAGGFGLGFLYGLRYG